MGRSGGGGGAGRSGGGRSGGSRSGGGRSARSSGPRSTSSFGGSSRPSGGFGAGPRPSGSFGGPRPAAGGFGGRPYRPPHGPMYHRPAPRGGRPIGCGGLLGTMIFMIVLLVIIGTAFGGIRNVSSGSHEYSYEVSNTSSITKSTVAREKLHLNLSDATGYYTDECDWIHNETTLVNGLKSFYDKTGILPYVYIIDNIEGDYDPSTEKIEQFAETKYSELFPDDGHLLLMFWDYDGAYEYTVWLGTDTTELMDREACDILFDYLDHYYYAADTEEAFFAESFAQAGSRIMTVQHSFSYYLTRIAVVAVVVYVVYYFVKKQTAEKKRREEEL